MRYLQHLSQINKISSKKPKTVGKMACMHMSSIPSNDSDHSDCCHQHVLTVSPSSHDQANSDEQIPIVVGI